MKTTLPPDLSKATRLTRGGRLVEATSLIQRLLGGGIQREASANASGTKTDGSKPETEIALVSTKNLDSGQGTVMTNRNPRHSLNAAIGRIGRMLSGGSPTSGPTPSLDLDGQARNGRFLAASHSSQNGTREYKLYVPSGYRGQPLPLVVMLHGCTQSADDFAVGTGMNALAEERTFLVAYPVQPTSANGQRCWNWFNPVNQRRGHGEPAILAGIAEQIGAEYTVDPKRIYVAGLSAGGAAAAIMGATYPDIFAAVGVHSGLACGAASNIASALSAMNSGGNKSSRHSVHSTWFHGQDRLVPTIVFHGDNDRTVHPRNGDHVIDQFAAAATANLRGVTEPGRVSGGRTYERTSHVDATGRVVLENWVIHGAGHAWSGGSAEGTYTDSKGPDASREMIRFFLEHPHPHSTPKKL